MAKLWNLPILFIIENNHYAMGTSVSRSSSNIDLYKRGMGFDIKGYKINGMDIIDVITKSQDIINEVRSGKGPVIIEMDTYRYRGHSMSDPATYRTKDELSNKKEEDPIQNFKDIIIKNYKIKEDQIKEIDNEVKQQVAEIVEFSKNSPQPDESELLTDIYH